MEAEDSANAETPRSYNDNQMTLASKGSSNIHRNKAIIKFYVCGLVHKVVDIPRREWLELDNDIFDFT